MQGMYVLVLDEMDQACKKTNETVAEIFALCSIPRSRLIVISIANRLDLASRVLQPTGLGHGAAPHVVPFHSYTARQLLELLEVRFSLSVCDHTLQSFAHALPCCLPGRLHLLFVQARPRLVLCLTQASINTVRQHLQNAGEVPGSISTARFGTYCQAHFCSNRGHAHSPGSV